MSNGTTRLALSKIQLSGKKGTAELQEEMGILSGDPSKGGSKPKKQNKIPLKNPTENNHSA